MNSILIRNVISKWNRETIEMHYTSSHHRYKTSTPQSYTLTKIVLKKLLKPTKTEFNFIIKNQTKKRNVSVRKKKSKKSEE